MAVDKLTDALMEAGATIVADIERLVRTVSVAIRTDFRYGVMYEPVQIVLLFAITDLGGSDEAQVKAFIHDRLLAILKEPTMVRHKIQWGFEVTRKEQQ